MDEACREVKGTFKVVRWLIYSTTLTFLIFAPRLIILGMEIAVYQVTSIIGLSYGAYLLLRRRNFSRQSSRFIALWLAASAYSLVITFFSGYYDLEMLRNMVYGLALYCFALLLWDFYRRQTYFFRGDMLGLIYTAGVIHALLMALQFNFEEIKELGRILFVHTETGLLFLDTNTRATGFTSGGGSALSAINASMIALGFYWKEIWQRYRLISDCLFWCGQALLVYAIFISGRAGLFIGLLVISAYLLFRMTIYCSKEIKYIVSKKDVWLPLMLLLFFFLIFVGVINFEESKRVWVFEPFYSAHTTGEFKSKSTDIILDDMLFLPEKRQSLLFGTGNAGRANDETYIASDVGYIRLIFYCGFLGLTLWLMPFLSLILESRVPKKISSLVPVLLIVQAVMMSKELFFVLPQGWTLLFFLVCVSLRGNKKYVAY